MNKKHLIIFDIDGTLTDSSDIDDTLFQQTFFDLYNLKISDEKWEEYKKLSTHNDNSTALRIFKDSLKINDINKELTKFKSHFIKLLEKNANNIIEIQGATGFINDLRANINFGVGIATGSWSDSGIIKLKSIGISFENLPYGNADLFNTRTEIISYVISNAKAFYNNTKFSKITYIGDGVWDFKAAELLGIDFIGVDKDCNGMLKNLGASRVIKNFREQSVLLNHLLK